MHEVIAPEEATRHSGSPTSESKPRQCRAPGKICLAQNLTEKLVLSSSLHCATAELN